MLPNPKNQKVSLLLFSLLFIFNTTFAQNDFNLPLLGNKTYGNQTLAGTWGYVKNGVEYALVGTNTGVSIVDITNPAVLNEVQFVPSSPSLWHEIRTFGDYAYITSEGGLGLQIIDLSLLPNSAPSKYYKGNGAVNNLLNQFHSLHIDNGFAYLYGGDFENGGVVIVNLANPWFPNYVGKWQDHYIHDGFVQDNKIWACRIFDGQFTVLDVTNKATPIELASQVTPNRFAHSNWMSTDKKYMFVADEIDGESLTSFDISNLNNIKQLDRYTADFEPDALPHNVYLINDSLRTGSNRDFLVVAHNSAGVTILDVSQPEKMVEIAYFDTQKNNATYGIWGAYPYFPSGRIVGGDSNFGLCVFQPTYQKASFLKGLVTDINSNPLNEVNIQIIGTTFVEKTNLAGKYLHGSRLNGTYSIKFSKAGFQSKTLNNVNINTNLNTLNVILNIVNLVNATGNVRDIITQIPVANAEIELDGFNGRYNVAANSAGIFQFNQIPEDDYELFAGKFGYKTFYNSSQSINSSTNLTIDLTKGIEDQFELNYGWTVSGDATAGAWERAVPIGSVNGSGIFYNPGEDDSDLGRQCFVTGNGPLGSGINDFDVDGGTTILTSPTFDLTGIVEPFINYTRWIKSDGSDTIKVFLSNGIIKQQIEVGRGNVGLIGVWVKKSFKVSSFIPATSTMNLIVEVSDKKLDGAVEAGFDNFFVSGTTSGVNEIGNADFGKINILPNPASSNFVIDYYTNDKNANNLELSIYNNLGQLVFAKKLSNNKDSIAINLELPSGIYFAKINSENGNQMTQKFSKL